MLGVKRVKPCVYFRPIAQTTSSRPAINKTIQDISGSRTMGPSPVKEAFAGRPAKLMCEMAFLPERK
jgi:hypothetical protein